VPFLVHATAAVRLQLDWCEHMQLVVILQVCETAKDIDGAMRELPDANMKPEDLWAKHSLSVSPKPHSKQSKSWAAINEVRSKGQNLGLKDFRPIKPLGCGDTGR
jgi:hypothetical protein